jgi:hypothetical protein
MSRSPSRTPSTPYAGEIATTATVRHPLGEQDWPYSTDRDAARPANGWWIKVTLDLATGDITAEPSTGREQPFRSRNHAGEIYIENDDAWLHCWDWSRWPRRIVFLHDMWPMRRDQVVTMLDWVEPHAQGLLDTIERLPGGGYDWTREAIAHFWRILHIVQNIEGEKFHTERGTFKDYETKVEGVISFDQAIEWYPALIDPAWRTLDDDALDEVALRLTQSYPTGGRPWVTWEMESTIAERAGWGDYDVARDIPRGHYPTYVVGARAGLRRMRDAAVIAMTGMRAEPVQRWLCHWGSDGPIRWPRELTENTTDRELEQLARQIELTAAEQDQVAVVGALPVLRAQRNELRKTFRARLGGLGERTEAAFQEYLSLRTAREGALAMVIGWGDPEDRNEDGSLKAAELGRLGRVSRQAIAQLADRLAADAQQAEPAA